MDAVATLCSLVAEKMRLNNTVYRKDEVAIPIPCQEVELGARQKSKNRQRRKFSESSYSNLNTWITVIWRMQGILDSPSVLLHQNK